MARLGTVPGTTYHVTEVWTGGHVMALRGGAPLATEIPLPADGGSAYYLITPAAK